MNASSACVWLVITRGRPPARVTYSVTEAARLAGIHPELVRHYRRRGLLGPAPADAGHPLDDDALYQLLRYERYRRHYGVSRRTLRLLCQLWGEVARLEREVRARERP